MIEMFTVFKFTKKDNSTATFNNCKVSYCLYKNEEILHSVRACKGVG